jgi:sulfite reductase beta subunit-like hemoprotein
VLTDYLGWYRQANGLWFVGLPLLCGRLEGDRKRGLRQLVETYQLEVRLTPNQDLLLCNIGTSQRSGLKAALAELGFATPETPPPLARHAIACPALPTCGLAVTESERILPAVLDRLDALLDRLAITKPLLVRMTGCPNGCARPYMAELGLVGSGVDQYQLWLGGSPGLTRLAEPYLERMPLEDLERTLEPLLTCWRDEGSARSSFGDFIERLGGERKRGCSVVAINTAELNEPRGVARAEQRRDDAEERRARARHGGWGGRARRPRRAPRATTRPRRAATSRIRAAASAAERRGREGRARQEAAARPRARRAGGT